MIPILHSSGLMMPGQLGPIIRVLVDMFSACFTRTMSCVRACACVRQCERARACRRLCVRVDMQREGE